MQERNNITPPQHSLRAYGVALQLIAAVRRADIADTNLRDHALRSAQSAALNTAECAGRAGRRDKARVAAIARAECVEAAAAAEIAFVSGAIPEAAHLEVAGIASTLYAMLTGLVRR